MDSALRRITSFFTDIYQQTRTFLWGDRVPIPELPAVLLLLKQKYGGRVFRKRCTVYAKEILDEGLTMSHAQYEVYLPNQTQPTILMLSTKYLTSTHREDVTAKFKREVLFYTKVLPAIVAYQRTVKVQEKDRKEMDKCRYDKFFLNCIGAAISTVFQTASYPDLSGAIVFDTEELDEYTCRERIFEGFDFATAKTAVENLARIHAVPMAMRLLTPRDFFENVLPCLFHVRTMTESPTYAARVNDVISDALSFQWTLESYLDSLRETVKQSKYNGWLRQAETTSNWFTVSHPFYDVKSIRMARPERFRKDIKVDVDGGLQFGSGLRDLALFLFTSVRPDELDLHYQSLCSIYYDTFVRAMRLHCYSHQYVNYTDQYFKFDLYNRGHGVFADVLLRLAFIKSNVFDPETGFPVVGAEYRKRIRYICQLMLKKGFIQPGLDVRRLLAQPIRACDVFDNIYDYES